MKLTVTEISWGDRECKTKNLSWVEYGCILELHNLTNDKNVTI